MKETIKGLTDKINEAEALLAKYAKDETTKGKYERFMAKMTIKEYKDKLRRHKLWIRHRNILQRHGNKLKNQLYLKTLYKDLTFEQLGFTSKAEVRDSTLNEVINRTVRQFKKFQLTYRDATDIIKLLDERENFIIGTNR